MSFKCRFLARDKATAKSLVERYTDLPAGFTAMLTGMIEALQDDGPLGEGVLRVVEVYAEATTADDGPGNVKALVTYRLVL